jgi:hypothetical protein
VNAKIRARTQLLIGRPSLDDWELKVRRLVRHSKHRNEILDLEKGSFLFSTTDTIIKFSKFEATGRATEFTEQPKPKKSFVKRLWEAVTFSETTEPITTGDTDEDEDHLTEEIDSTFGDSESFEPM